MSETDYQIYDEKCQKMLDEEEIRFAGIINESGNLVSGGFKKEIDASSHQNILDDLAAQI